MCGFTGFARDDAGAPPATERLRAMCATLLHRGPDDEGLLERDGVALGFRRLSIIDLAGGHQPLWNEDENIAVVTNGEIYNYRELRAGLQARGHVFRTNSDVEALVHLYEEKGDAFVEDLVGMFAVCLVDFREPARPRVVLARDRVGIKPLYWARGGGALWWASEPKAILAGGAFARELSGTALVDYLVQGFTAGPDSAWRGLQRLEAGHRLSWRPGEAPRVERYWDVPHGHEREPAGAAELCEWIDRVVRDRLVADVPLGAFLSGGIDSTAVVTSMAAASPDPVVACSVGFSERSHDELARARATAERLHLVHHTEVLQPDPSVAVEHLPWFYDEPLADSSTVPTWLVSRMAREHVTVALSGDGGDEIFGGYRRYVYDVAENRVRALLGPLGCAAARGLGRHYPKLDRAPRFLRAKSTLENLGRDPARAYYASLTQLPLAEARAVLAPELRAALAQHDPFDAFEEHYRRPAIDDPLFRAQYADFKTFLPEQILTKTDRASMAVSLEVRVPLLDHRFVERFVTLPRDEKVRGGRGKHALREALRARVPASVLDGEKRGFDTPLRAWLRGPMAGAVEEALHGLPTDWIDRSVTLARLEEHRRGARDHSSLLWSLLVLEHWRRRHEVARIAV
ncbi:MAG: asparagine synthase (glutamine-hydrolyzing) [Planctomycetes bacterium]|nr:asparagine synthase (glutamine-hydrolyzing) [Planctomycetota bacterium]